MNASAQLPGLAFTRAAPAAEAAPLRSDVAGFAGRTRRGPVAQRIRVEGWNDYLRWFGGLDAGAYTPYAVRGYFENGGKVAHVVRLGDPGDAGAPRALEAARLAGADWPLGLPRGGPVPGGFSFGRYRIEAASPGAWANRTRIHARYRREAGSANAELDLAIETPGEPFEYLSGLVLGAPDADGADPLQRQVAARSTLLRLVPRDVPLARTSGGPRRYDWQLLLDGGADAGPSDGARYAAALAQLIDEPEVALMVLPDLYRDFDGPGQAPLAEALLAGLLVQVDAGRDRMLLLDVPPGRPPGAPLAAWLDALGGRPRSLEARSGAVYYPWLSVPDPLGGAADPLKAVPPGGHVAGVISKLDRERGPHYTPANASLLDAVDLAEQLDREAQARLDAGGVNLLVCSAGQGLQVWGASTLARTARDEAAPQVFEADHFIACRRLVHRLVRAIRRVAEPLVFDTNGPELWLALVRAVTAVLLEAYRGGGLKGARPDEAFYVRCDEQTNPPAERALGRCVCEIGLAPVAPMEFIVFRVALGGEGTLEVFES